MATLKEKREMNKLRLKSVQRELRDTKRDFVKGLMSLIKRDPAFGVELVALFEKHAGSAPGR